MSGSLVEQIPVQLQSLMTFVGQLQKEVCKLRRENAELRQQVSELRCEVGYWKSMHARAAGRNTKLQAELDQAKAEVRQLKAERFGKQSEKQSTTDRSNPLDDPQEQSTPKKKRGQQPGRPAPERRDYSHLPAREEQIDLPDDAKVCDCCGKTLADLGQSDISEQIEMETIVYRRVIRRKRYRRTCDCADRQRTVTAPLPPKLLRKSIYGTSLWVHLLLEKFHLQRPTSTMLRTVPDDRAASTVGSEPCAGNNRRWTEANRAAANAALRSDSCPPLAVGVLSRGRDAMESFRGKSWKNGASLLFWLFAGEDTVVYVLDPSRSHHVPQSHFPDDMQGVLTVDRTSAYKAMQQVKSGNLLLAFC